jgi:hydrophobe/amphiphile efflux-3 (HAE3) family protein
VSARLLSALAGGAARRPRAVLLAAILLAAGGVALALSLRPSAAASTLVSSSSPEYRQTQRYDHSFGEEPIEVLVNGNLQKLVLSSDLERLLGLEGCLSGNVPVSALPSEGGVSGPCGKLAAAHTIKVVLGPGTFVNEATEVINEQLVKQTKSAEAQASAAADVVSQAALARGLGAARAAQLAASARKIWMARFQEGLVTLALQYGLTSKPSLQDTNFVSSLVFAPDKPAGTPRAKLAYLFPGREAALVSVRMKPGLSQAQRDHTISLVRQAVAMPEWHLANGERYLVTGGPVVASDLTGELSHAILLLLVAVALVMAATLALIFTERPRLLPLALAGLATALTFGALALVGAPLTMASIAVLPVLVGLSVDYAIQFQARVGETEPVPGDPAARIARAAAHGAPTIATAAAASAAAILVLLLSPVPMVQGFSVLLVVGLGFALLCTLTAGAGALALSSSRREARPPRAGGVGSSLAAGTLGASWRGAGRLLRENPLTRALSGIALGSAVRHPRRVLWVGLALALAGWALDTQTSVQTDITKLVPQNLASLQALQTLEHTSGVGGEVALLVSGKNVARPATIEWMSSYERNVLSHFGFSSSHGCGKARVCPAFSLPDLFSAESLTGAQGGKLNPAQVEGLLKVIPPYFSQDVISPDHGEATLAFGVKQMSLTQEQHVIEAMRSRLHPPAGVSASLVGLPVLASSSGAKVADPWRRLLTLLAGLLAVALVLTIAFRGDRKRVLVPLVPVALASGWSALILFAVRVPLNPMSVTLGVLVVALSTEFSVLLSERHRQERLAGLSNVEALRRSYQRTGAAVAASAVTAIAGFGVLAISEIEMLRQFGLVTLIDLSASLLGVLIALPAALIVAYGTPEGRRVRRSLNGRGLRWRGRLGGRGLLARLGVGGRTPAAGSGHEPA